MSFKPYPKPDKKKPLKKPRKASDATLWKWFSIYIRLRDCVYPGGYGHCITCKKIIHWKKGNCGHGVGRQHWGTKYNEKNNHLQCVPCNYPGEGRKDLYEPAVNKKYGPNTWDLLQSSRDGKKLTSVEIKILLKHYKSEALRLAKEKGQEI